MLLRNHGTLEDDRFRYLMAKFLAEVDEWDECLALIGDGELDEDVPEVRMPSMVRSVALLTQQITKVVHPAGNEPFPQLCVPKCSDTICTSPHSTVLT